MGNYYCMAVISIRDPNNEGKRKSLLFMISLILRKGGPRRALQDVEGPWQGPSSMSQRAGKPAAGQVNGIRVRSTSHLLPFVLHLICILYYVLLVFLLSRR